jgi:hypothetical protein
MVSSRFGIRKLYCYDPRLQEEREAQQVLLLWLHAIELLAVAGHNSPATIRLIGCALRRNSLAPLAGETANQYQLINRRVRYSASDGFAAPGRARSSTSFEPKRPLA